MGFNALSGLYIISTGGKVGEGIDACNVSMPSRAYTSFLHQCCSIIRYRCRKCQCPLGLIHHFYGKADRNNLLGGSGVSMPSRAYTSFLRYPFKNLGFMRFPEPVFAGIYQNILTTAIFRAC